MIWCIEDEKSILDIELYTLNMAGFETKGFEDGESFLEALKIQKPDLILLDVMLPKKDGVEILRTLKKSSDNKDIPVIMATAKGMEYDKIQSLDLGADDYLVKPFGMMEMVSRVKAVLRRCKRNENAEILELKHLRINNVEHTVEICGHPITLTLKEYEILRLFLSHPGMVYTRDQLFNEVWGSDYCGESRTVDVHIRTLRLKLGEYGDYIKTVRGVGYRMDTDLEETND